MTARSALITVVMWGLVFAGIGAAIGAGIGVVAPGYYRSVFAHGDAPGFDPLQVGVGLGAIQGLASGIVLSLVVLGLLAWRDVRIARPSCEDHADALPRQRSWTVHAVWGIVTAMCVVSVGGITFLLGGFAGQQQLYQAWTERKLDRLETILEDERFAGLEADYSSAAQVFLIGDVGDHAALDALRDELVMAFGREEAEDILRTVGVER